MRSIGLSISIFMIFQVFASSSPAIIAAASSEGTKIMASSAGMINHPYKSFREWKAAMIFLAQEKVNQTQAALIQKQRGSASMTSDPNLVNKNTLESGLRPDLIELQQQAEKDQYQLSITKDLTISDYFVGYVTKQKDLSAAIKEVSGRLTPEEISELMFAYANNFFSSKPSPAANPARAESN